MLEVSLAARISSSEAALGSRLSLFQVYQNILSYKWYRRLLQTQNFLPMEFRPSWDTRSHESSSQVCQHSEVQVIGPLFRVSWHQVMSVPCHHLYPVYLFLAIIFVLSIILAQAEKLSLVEHETPLRKRVPMDHHSGIRPYLSQHFSGHRYLRRMWYDFCVKWWLKFIPVWLCTLEMGSRIYKQGCSPGSPVSLRGSV